MTAAVTLTFPLGHGRSVTVQGVGDTVVEIPPPPAADFMTAAITRREGITWLEEDGGHVPCSRYGSCSSECAPVAWRLAYVLAREQGTLPVTREQLDYAMGLVVNDHDDVAYIIRAYGHGHYR